MALWARTAEGAVATAQQAWAFQGLEEVVWMVKAWMVAPQGLDAVVWVVRVLMVVVVVGMWAALMVAGAMVVAI